MSLELYAAYLIATLIVLVIPGPTVMLVLGYSLSEGRRCALSVVAGVALGDLTAMTLSLAGLGAIMTTSTGLFTVFKMIGAAYLVYLGIKTWRSRPAGLNRQPAECLRSGRVMMGHAFAVTALNPKGIMFFAAFLPQFIQPARPVLPQLILLGGTFLILAIINATIYALVAGSIRETINRPSVLRRINRVGGGVLIGAGIMTAALRRTL
jgi:homoserine/homoserine lactone efflux protein